MSKRIAVLGLPGAWSSETLAENVEKITGEKIILDPAQLKLDLVNDRLTVGEHNLADFDGIILKKLGREYTPFLIDRLDMLKYVNKFSSTRFFSPLESIQLLLDRLSCTLVLRKNDIPMPETTITECVDEALDVIQKYKKVVIKPLFTSKARGMQILTAAEVTKELLERYKKEVNPVLYIQKIVTHMGKDLGISFLGGEYIATYARVGKEGEWNTTINSGGKYQPYEPSKEIIDLAYRAQSLFNMDFTCVDIVETPEGPLVFEVSAFGGFRGLLDANGINIAEKYANYVAEKL